MNDEQDDPELRKEVADLLDIDDPLAVQVYEGDGCVEVGATVYLNTTGTSPMPPEVAARGIVLAMERELERRKEAMGDEWFEVEGDDE